MPQTHQESSFLLHSAADNRERARQVCAEALAAQEQAQELVKMYTLVLEESRLLQRMRQERWARRKMR